MHSRVRTRCTHPAGSFFRKAESSSKNLSPERRISRKTAVDCLELRRGAGLGELQRARSGYLTVVLREIRRLESGFSQVDSVFLKKSQPGAFTVYAPGCVIFIENEVDMGKPRPQTSDLAWVRYHQQNINATSIILLMLRLLMCSSQRRTLLSYPCFMAL